MAQDGIAKSMEQSEHLKKEFEFVIWPFFSECLVILYFTGEGTQLIPEKRVCRLIDEMLGNGVTDSNEISRIIQQAHGIEVPPHIIAEYKYRERKRRFLAEAE